MDNANVSAAAREPPTHLEIMRAFRSITLLLLTLSTLFACGSSGDDPTVTAEGFLRAIQDRDQATFTSLMTEEARAVMAGGDGFELGGDEVVSFEIGESRVDGEEAEVTALVTEKEKQHEPDLLLRKEAGEWRVYGMRMEEGGIRLTIDFEKMGETLGAMSEAIGDQLKEAFSDVGTAWAQGGTVEEIAEKRAAFEAISAVTPEELEAVSLIDVDVAGRAALAVIEELVTPAGLAVEAGEHTEALATTVSLTLPGVSRIEAVERVAETAGLYPVWPTPGPYGFVRDDMKIPGPLTFAAGPRPYPIFFTGPFLLEITALTERAPQPVGSIELAVRALGLPAAVLAYQGEMLEMLHVDRVRGAEDQPLADEEVSHFGAPEQRAGYLSYKLEKELTGLLRGVEVIDSIAGEILLSIPVSVEAITWERGEDAPRTLAAGTLTVTEWAEQTQFQLEGDEAAIEGLEVRTSPRQATGEPLGVTYESTGGWGSTRKASLQCPEVPAAIDLKLCRVEELRYPFLLRGVALSRFAEQPEQIEALTFEGPAPVEVQLDGALRRNHDQSEVTLRLKNHSNKDATTLQVRYVYLDAAGAELDDFPHSLTGSFNFDGQQEPLVAAGGLASQETWATFMPEGTSGIHFEVQSVGFPDGTSWEAE